MNVRLAGLELNHGTDITSKAVYAKMEQAPNCRIGVKPKDQKRPEIQMTSNDIK